jgi:hypothetical protein
LGDVRYHSMLCIFYFSWIKVVNQLSSLIRVLWRKSPPSTAYLPSNYGETFFCWSLCSSVPKCGTHWAPSY